MPTNVPAFAQSSVVEKVAVAPSAPVALVVAETPSIETKVANQATETVKKEQDVKKTKGSKSKEVAAVLAFFLGGLGIHRFYLGYTWQGVVQLLTAGGLGIWAFVDFVRILLGKLEPKDGSYK